MTWVAVDDDLWSRAAFIGLTGDAAKLYLASYALCGAQLTDGVVTDATVLLLARMYRLKNSEALAAELLASELWSEGPDGHVITDYLRINRSAVEVEAARRKTREKVANWREKQRGVTGLQPGTGALRSAPNGAPNGTGNGVTPDPSQNHASNGVTALPVTDTPTPTPTPDVHTVSRKNGEVLDTALIDWQLRAVER
jgi:hypothetical protein